MSKKCNFPKMGYREHASTKTKSKKEINKVIADQKKRRKEWKAWLVGYNG